MMAIDYAHVLETYLPLFLKSLGKEIFTFQDDNAPTHTVKKNTKQKLDNTIPCLPWPAQSPDLNPIEHLWEELERRVHGCGILPKNGDELFNLLREEWEKIPVEKLEKLVDSMLNHVQAVCKGNGYQTSYQYYISQKISFLAPKQKIKIKFHGIFIKSSCTCQVPA